MPFFLYIYTFAGSEKVLENFSWGFWKVLDFLAVKDCEPCSSSVYTTTLAESQLHRR